jgi:hypothetical protein
MMVTDLEEGRRRGPLARLRERAGGEGFAD